MEHRNSRRIPISIKVELLGSKGTHGVFDSRNIGYGGLFVDCNVRVDYGDVLTAKIATRENGDPQCHELNVKVTHIEQSGVGLKWYGYHIPFFNALDMMMSGAA